MAAAGGARLHERCDCAKSNRGSSASACGGGCGGRPERHLLGRDPRSRPPDPRRRCQPDCILGRPQLPPRLEDLSRPYTLNRLNYVLHAYLCVVATQSLDSDGVQEGFSGQRCYYQCFYWLRREILHRISCLAHMHCMGSDHAPHFRRHQYSMSAFESVTGNIWVPEIFGYRLIWFPFQVRGLLVIANGIYKASLNR